MNGTRESHTLWVCVDCLMAHVAGETEPGSDPWALVSDGADVTPGLLRSEHDCECPNFAPDGTWLGVADEPCEAREFSWSACEGCGSPLGGSRYAFTVWE